MYEEEIKKLKEVLNYVRQGFPDYRRDKDITSSAYCPDKSFLHMQYSNIIKIKHGEDAKIHEVPVEKVELKKLRAVAKRIVLDAPKEIKHYEMQNQFIDNINYLDNIVAQNDDGSFDKEIPIRQGILENIINSMPTKKGKVLRKEYEGKVSQYGLESTL